MEELNTSLLQYKDQLKMVTEALQRVEDNPERESLLELQSELQQLIQLTQESLDATSMKISNVNTTSMGTNSTNGDKSELDDEYALFMQEMTKSGAYESGNHEKPGCSKSDNHTQSSQDDDSDIEDELATLLGMKCAVYHTHKWGGQPSLHNAMVSAVVPRQDDDQFKDLQVRVLFTHPTHTEMLPCPFYLDGECKFDDEKCRYSHGAIVPLSNLKEATDPNFDSIKIGSRILLKLKPPDDEDISLTKRTTEMYHLWHRAIVKHVDFEKRICVAKLEHGAKSGDKRKSSSDELHVSFEELFPLTTEGEQDSDSDDSISDTEYPESKTMRSEEFDASALLVERSLEINGPTMGEWERHTRVRYRVEADAGDGLRAGAGAGRGRRGPRAAGGGAPRARRRQPRPLHGSRRSGPGARSAQG